ncbi:MAG: M20/M25/M40 family metallo-hydrolase, partial [Pseudomonadota bacterium]|nr:M20/M25/M40 family metallo-hydrolase [Pseudomonadota bacterium]
MSQPSALEVAARRWSEALVGWMSVTGSDGEIAFPHKLANRLRSAGYFGDRPEDVHVLPISGDTRKRCNLLAFVRGQGRSTVVLTGHFDVVSIDNYGDLAPFAGSPDELTPRLLAELSASGSHPLALSDLQTGRFLPGRGMLDMKSGLAAGLAVLEAFAADPQRRGNLLFLAVPDEENQSAGMRAAAPELARFAA